MAATFVPICGPVVGATVYINNVLSARDSAVTLPEVTPMTADVQASGTMTVPIWQLLENMELAITKIGQDMGLRRMLTPGVQSVEVRFVQDVTDANGDTKQVGCKAFIRGIASKIPGIGIEVGSASENECTWNCTRYQLYVDGEEMFLIDRLAGRVRIAGIDYSSGVNSML